MYNIVGDIAGQEKTLKALLAQMPAGQLISLGDMVDRGPDSAKTLEFVRANGLALMGNHEHIMWKTYELAKKFVEEKKVNSQLNSIDFALRNKSFYHPRQWMAHGGAETLASYGAKVDFNTIKDADAATYFQDIIDHVDPSHIQWMKSLPLYFQLDNNKLFLSHAPRPHKVSLEDAAQEGPGAYPYDSPKSQATFLWNRNHPRPLKGTLQLFGHNNEPAVRYYTSHFLQGIFDASRVKIEDVYAIGIDTSKARVLTGIHYPTLKVYQQPYLD